MDRLRGRSHEDCAPCATFSVVSMAGITVYAGVNYYQNRPYPSTLRRLAFLSPIIVFGGLTVRQWLWREELKSKSLTSPPA